MRILVCNWKDMSHPAAGGAEVYVDAVTRHWVEWGHAVTLFCARAPGQAAEDEVGGVRIVRGGNRFGVYREARRFIRGGQGHFDVVLDVVNTRPFLCPEYVVGIPVVALIFQVAREIWSYEVPPGAAAVGRHWLEPRWLRRYSSVPTLTISESSRDSLLSYGLSQVSIVPVGLELPQVGGERPPKERRPTVAFLGRLAANKRPDHALRAFRAARPALAEPQMWVVGSGPMEASLRREFAREPVRFFGRLDERKKLDLLARAHALLVTSVREGWGLVVTEAAAVGTPSIGYDVPGLRDSLRASNGVLVGATVGDLATVLADVLPRWVAGAVPAVAPGGVSSWSDVATAILDHLEWERVRSAS